MMSLDKKTWRSTPEHIDRQARKQAEFLVREFMPASCIHSLVVNSEERKAYFEQLVDNLQLDIKVYLDNKCKLYY